MAPVILVLNLLNWCDVKGGLLLQFSGDSGGWAKVGPLSLLTFHFECNWVALFKFWNISDLRHAIMRSPHQSQLKVFLNYLNNMQPFQCYCNKVRIVKWLIFGLSAERRRGISLELLQGIWDSTSRSQTAHDNHSHISTSGSYTIRYIRCLPSVIQFNSRFNNWFLSVNQILILWSKSEEIWRWGKKLSITEIKINFPVLFCWKIIQ